MQITPGNCCFLHQEKNVPRNLPCPSTLGADSCLDKQHSGDFRSKLNPPPPSAPKDVMDETYKKMLHMIPTKPISGDKMVQVLRLGCDIIVAVSSNRTKGFGEQKQIRTAYIWI